MCYKKIQNGLKWVKRKPPYTNLHPVSDWRCGCTQRREKEKLWNYYNTGSQQVSASSTVGVALLLSGRRVDDMPAHSLNIRLDTGDDEAGDEITFNNVRHSLPKKKKKKKKQHSLAADVQSNRPVSKK